MSDLLKSECFEFLITLLSSSLGVKGGIMDDKFLFGMLLGVIGGAVIATNSARARQMVRDGQEQVKEKMEEVSSCSQKKNHQ